MKTLFTVLFDDNSIYEGGDNFFTPKWGLVPKDKKIRSLFISLPEGDNLLLSGYDKYYYRVEGCKDLNGANAGILVPEFIFVYGKKDNFIKIYKIRIKENRVEYSIIQDNNLEITRLNQENWR